MKSDLQQPVWKSLREEKLEGKGQVHKEIKVRSAWEHAKLIGVMLFAMAAGAAVYHQYIVQNYRQTPEPEKETVAAGQRDVQEPEILEETQAEKDEPEEQTDEPEEEIEMDELELLAICVEAEAGNQEVKGKRLVVDVILNRVDDSDLPDTIEGVISQPYQFSSYWDGGMDRVTEPSEETIRAVQMELEERGWPGVIYFTAETWPEYGTPWKQVGDHFFNTK